MRQLRGQRENTASPVFACWTVFTELLPGNALMNPLHYCISDEALVSFTAILPDFLVSKS
jgi:hypothetical protein